MEENISKEKILEKLQNIKENFFVKQNGSRLGNFWDEEKARQGAEIFNMFVSRYFTNRSNHQESRIDTQTLHETVYIKDIQSYIDSAFGKIEALITDINEYGYSWDDFHSKLPVQPTRIEQWINVNKNSFSLIRSIVPVIALIGFAYTGQLQSIDWPGATTASITVIAFFFPDLKDFFHRIR